LIPLGGSDELATRPAGLWFFDPVAFDSGEERQAGGLSHITCLGSKLTRTGLSWAPRSWQGSGMRLFPDAACQGRFLADYAHYRFGARGIVVVREKGTAGEEFASALRDRAKSQGIRIDADLEFLPAEAKDPAAMEALAQRAAKAPKGEIIVLGSQYAETPALLRALRDRLGPFTSLGYSSLATESLNGSFAQLESDHRLPMGYYTGPLV
jgi:ABC-type branched-subunit amino acid transport system substrate-binding protein